MMNFTKNMTKKEITIDVVKMLQKQLEQHYHWYLCESDESGDYREIKELDEEQKIRLEVLGEISKALDKMV